MFSYAESGVGERKLGLFNRLVPVDRLAAEVAAVADRIAGNAPLTVQRLKLMTTRGWDLPIPAALRLDAGPETYHSADRQEGTRAFVERRLPRWQGR